MKKLATFILMAGVCSQLSAQNEEDILRYSFQKLNGTPRSLGMAGAMGVVGPNLTHFGERTSLGAGLFTNDTEHLTKWLEDPQAMKPGNLMNLKQVNMVLSNSDIKNLTAYLQSLK